MSKRLEIDFFTKRDVIRFCKKHGLDYQETGRTELRRQLFGVRYIVPVSARQVKALVAAGEVVDNARD